MNRHSQHDTVSSPLSTSLKDNIAALQDTFADCDDLVFRYTRFSDKPACLVYLSGMVNEQTLFEIEQSFPSNSTDKETELPILIQDILSGQIILLTEGASQAMIIHSAPLPGRKVSRPTTERTVKGPQEGFVEDIQTNIRLIRRKLKTPSLKMEYLTLGRQSHTQISVVYLKGIANEEIVAEVHQRLARIDIDAILDSHYLESMIAGSPKSPFPTIYSTERPDHVCGALLDGKVAILTDGTPFALTLPALFVEFLHSSDDYYNGSLVSTIVRWARFLGLFVTLILPGFYVALTTFHPDLLQANFLLRLAANRDALPYPVMVEGIFMLITFELLREAGLRMPSLFGGAVVTLLGLVLISQIAVQAGLIGAEMTIVVAVSSLTSFILPNYAFQQITRYCSIPILILAGIFGFMGIIVVLMAGLVHLISLRSFGVPYFSPVSPARKEGWKDVFIRAPWWAMDTRSPGLDIPNNVRSGEIHFEEERHELK